MKYIRTENGHIYEYVEQRIYPNQYAKFGLYRHNLNSEYEQIIAEADTIEELCDYVIWVDKETKDIVLITDIHNTNNNEYSKEELNDIDVYYAIKLFNNDKVDIVSVAKMNDKGEFELI